MHHCRAIGLNCGVWRNYESSLENDGQKVHKRTLFSNTHKHTDRQPASQPDRQTDRQTDTHTHAQRASDLGGRLAFQPSRTVMCRANSTTDRHSSSLRGDMCVMPIYSLKLNGRLPTLSQKHSEDLLRSGCDRICGVGRIMESQKTSSCSESQDGAASPHLKHFF